MVLETCADHDITLDDEVLNVQLYVEEKEETGRPGERFSVVAGSNDDEDDGDNCTVEVSGFTESTSQDNLYYYFSNEKKGGGDIHNMSMDKEEMKAHIVFKDKRGNVGAGHNFFP